MAVTARAFARLRIAAWLGWQIESNWADIFTFLIYSIIRPAGTALILTGMWWAVADQAARPEAFAAFYVANAFHEYVLWMVIGMGWVIVGEREEYETLRYVVVSPIGMLTYLSGRAATKFVLSTSSVLLLLLMGWFVLGVRWDLAAVRWLPLLVTLVLGWIATLFLGFLVAGWALILPRIAISMNEGLAVGLYLMCGVIFPIDLLPRVLQLLSLALPFTYWYEAIRRFLLGHGASQRLGEWSDPWLLLALAGSTAVFAALSLWGYDRLERHARRTGRLDQTTLF